MTTTLSAASLKSLPAGVAAPGYDPSALSGGILHFGVGNFHRAHQAVYLDDLFSAGGDHEWALVGAGVLPSDEVMRQKLKAQDWLTTVVEQDSTGMSARVTAAMIDYLQPGDAAATIARLADPAIRIVSLTITEGGYFIDPASQKFNPDHADIVRDAGAMAAPSTVFGLILAGLMARREAGIAPFTVMSCDNIPHNGKVTRDAVVGLAAKIDPALASWVHDNVAFPNGMVDRITPATSERERSLLTEKFDIDDNWPVFCEPFKQWVLEDRFPAGRPELEKVGVTFVGDVSPYELMKIRILNGGHAAIAYPGGLMDIHFVHEAMEEPLIRAYLAKLEREEIIPTVPPVPDTDLDGYFGQIEARFSNPRIGDTIRRLCLDGSNRQPKFIIPTIADRLKAGQSVEGLALVSALWCRYCQGVSDSGAVIEPNDPNWTRLQATALAAQADPGRWLAMADIYGEVGQSALFAEAFGRVLREVEAVGARGALARYLGG